MAGSNSPRLIAVHLALVSQAPSMAGLKHLPLGHLRSFGKQTTFLLTSAKDDEAGAGVSRATFVGTKVAKNVWFFGKRTVFWAKQKQRKRIDTMSNGC